MPTNRKTAKTLGSSRIIRLFGEINEELANKVIDQLIKFDKKGRNDILLIIDSPGGDLDATISMYQVTQLLRCNVATLALSNAASAAGVLLACGASGKRMVMEQSIVMLHDISQEMSEDYHRCLESELLSLRISKKILNDILSKQNVKDPDTFLKAEATYVCGEEAIKCGLADHVVKNFDDVLKIVKI